MDLLDVQFWLLGRDVEHPGGNLLVRRGFRRQRSAQESSRYRRREHDGCVVVWRCGLLFRARQGRTLLLRGTRPVDVGATRVERLWRSTDIVRAARDASPSPPAALERACCWFAAYEQWVQDSVGVAHRVPPGPYRPQLAPPEPCAQHAAWLALAAAL